MLASVADRLIGPRTKFKRAEEHFDQLYAEIRGFLSEPEPYRFGSEEEPRTGDKVYRVQVVEDPPPRVAAIVGDSVHNLRSALDLLAWQLVDAGGGTPDGNTMFPIKRTKKAFETTGLAQVGGASEDAIRVLKALKPYKGGNDALWRLHRLDANDKHNLLVVLGIGQPPVVIPIGAVPPDAETFPGLQLTLANRKFPLVDGDEVFRLPAEAKNTPMDQDPKFAAGVALSDGEVVHGEPLIPVLNDLGRTVEEIIELFAPLL
jgi:hypothetical protein